MIKKTILISAAIIFGDVIAQADQKPPEWNPNITLKLSEYQLMSRALVARTKAEDAEADAAPAMAEFVKQAKPPEVPAESLSPPAASPHHPDSKAN
jgi:hypothetical protein